MSHPTATDKLSSSHAHPEEIKRAPLRPPGPSPTSTPRFLTASPPANPPLHDAPLPFAHAPALDEKRRSRSRLRPAFYR